METRHPATIGKDISLLGFGMMRLPRLDPLKTAIDYAAAERMVERALAAGVNYFDTAWPYHDGESEVFAGHALKGLPRQAFNLASKLPIWLIRSRSDIDRFFEEQLKRCQVEYFDFYLVHHLNADHYALAQKHDVYRVLREKQEQGLIGKLGFSFHDHPDMLERILEDQEWDFGQIQLNYVDWETLHARRQYSLLSERGIPVAVMEPLRGGALSALPEQAMDLLRKAAPAASAASWALRFAASLPGVMTVLSGMSAMDQLEDNISTLERFQPLSKDELDRLEAAAAIYHASGTIPCTGCRYCMDCPCGVDIPRVFSIYNHAQKVAPERAAMTFNYAYRSLTGTQQADNCASCRACVDHCPQSIDIPGQMETVARYARSARQS